MAWVFVTDARLEIHILLRTWASWGITRQSINKMHPASNQIPQICSRGFGHMGIRLAVWLPRLTLTVVTIPLSYPWTRSGMTRAMEGLCYHIVVIWNIEHGQICRYLSSLPRIPCVTLLPCSHFMITMLSMTLLPRNSSSIIQQHPSPPPHPALGYPSSVCRSRPFRPIPEAQG